MNDIPSRASAVIIGAGIVGNSLVYHLARLGWRDLVLIDKGPMPNPGGSTGHASNFIYPIDYSKMMMELTRDSTEQYKALGVFTESGGLEVARIPERMTELRREQAQESGALQVLAGTEVLGIDRAPDGRVTGVRTTGGDIATGVCAICC